MNKNMLTKTKIGIAALIIASFIVGGFALNAYQVGAFGRGAGIGHKFFGFMKGGFSKIDKDSEEWQARMEERKAKIEEFKAMTPEERRAKIGELKANMAENGERKGHAWGKCLFGFKGLKWFGDEVNHEIVNIDNGIQITITSDNPNIVQKLQDIAAKMHNLGQ